MAATRPTRRRRIQAAAVTAVALAVGLTPGLTAAAAPAPPAEGVIQNAGAPGAIKNSYIVTLDEDDADSGSSRGRSLVKKYGATIKRTYHEALNGYAVQLTEAEAKRLAADPAVAAVAQDQKVSIAATQTNPPSWGLDRIDQASLPLDGRYTYPDSAGEGVTAYIIDTGVRISHGDFGGRARYGYDAVDGDTSAGDGNGHGTHVAGTVAGASHGVAKKADIVAVRVLDNNGSGSISGVVAGVDWVTRNADKPAVANMSLGGGANSTLDAAVRNSIASGITYAVAAGNSNTNASGSSPARVAEAITVGSTTSSDARSSFSNYGSVLDIFAPGSSITSTWHTSDSATSTISGTSMASPHVAGAAALYLGENPSATPTQVAAGLDSAAVTGAISNPGSGSPNKLLNVGEGDPGDPGDPPGDPEGRFENTTDYPIRDNSTVESPITVSGISGNAPSDLKVEIDIRHTYIGDLQIDLIAPDGTAYRIKDQGTGGSADNVIGTYTVDASSEAANGTWKLRVRDSGWWDTGTINSWALQF
ncbi:S8 family serine peptidase [Streptomyces sp. TRM43335]|uniref:S8 family serine peptidase n=1 Tax=Streptomyces taklimakanensis TaxID=2569853 RepID=A0A6G2BEW6_9ACTN|nr:S8 family peptidase [Streptomyces taklimakanensis]MTE20821.1 S8 family serine peptidase [Streptomyces taklimakanensis]